MPLIPAPTAAGYSRRMIASLLFAVAAVALVTGVLLGYTLARAQCRAARHEEAVAVLAGLEGRAAGTGR
ncbi:hypothetical protein SAMN06264365_109110 [Actinoplanes regularis]|uniref:Uncharacterized protein n=2 Tax=Actinoplanes regularis TaxID=52697 RepID=A0A239BEI3_9ACTN|nr:hypothetical protein SAMN06264365_109110 [Actinoplanes regularis]